MYLATGEKVRAAFQVIVVIILYNHIFVTFSNLRNKFGTYDDWILRFNEILTAELRYKLSQA